MWKLSDVTGERVQGLQLQPESGPEAPRHAPAFLESAQHPDTRGLGPPVVNVQVVADRLERVERDSGGKEHHQDLHFLPAEESQQAVEVVGGEHEVLEEAEHPQVADE